MRFPWSPRPYAVVRPVNGLTNRLTAVASTLAFARARGLRFAMLWEPGVGFSDEGWHDLFANDLELWNRERYEDAIADGVPMFRGWKAEPCDPREVSRAVRARGLVFDHAFTPVDAHLQTGALRRLRPHRRAYKRALRAVRPAPPIARDIDAFAKAHFDGNVVGVHIRRGDATSGDNREHYVPSSDAAFADALDRTLAARPDTRFYLATDCEETQDRFVRRFPGRILMRDKTFVASEFGAPKAGQRDAVADLFLLARTRRIIGTRWSTFGSTAARLGGIRIDTAEARD